MCVASKNIESKNRLFMKNYKRSFRFVCKAHEEELVSQLLQAQGFSWDSDTFTSHACRLIDEPFPLGSSLAAFFGLIYIQDRASMLPPVALQAPKSALVLDMCASPGSKTGQLATMIGDDGFIIGNEPSPARLATLRRNLQQMNLFQVVTCCSEGQRIALPDGFFDYIQLDPPCSGWGTIDRNPKVMEMWKDDKTLPLIRLQKELLKEAHRLLKPGGVIVYSTCTTNVEENEKQVIYAQEELGFLFEDLPDLPEFVMDTPLMGCGAVWRLSPRPGDTQGFFVARFRKSTHAMPEQAEMNEEKTLWGNYLSKRHVEELGLDANILKHGNISIFGESVHFVHHKAELLPKEFAWQGMYMGKVSRAGDVQLSPRVRVLSDMACVDFEGMKGIEQIKGLLCGQSLNTEFTEKSILLRWNGLALGRLKIKNKRLIWTER